jgi:hypothetical protein
MSPEAWQKQAIEFLLWETRSTIWRLRSVLEQSAGYFLAFLACRFSFSVFCAGFFAMLFFAFLSLVAMFALRMGAGETVSRGRGCPPSFGGSDTASSASRLCRTHRRDSIFVDFDHVASSVCAAREASEALRSSRDDRVGVGAGLDHVTLFDPLVEERVEAAPARA